MSIIPPLPFTLTNGTVADASEVMANLNQIRDNVNANASGGGGSGNVVGPASAVDGNIAVFDGTTGKIIRDGGATPGYRGAVVRATASQSITAGPGVACVYDVAVIDTDSFFSGGAPTRLTVPAGVTRVRLLGEFVASGPFPNNVDIRLIQSGGNPVPTVFSAFRPRADGLITAQLSSPVLACVAGDYFEFMVFADFALTTIEAPTNWFEIQVVT
jgi:hypothetical protein